MISNQESNQSTDANQTQCLARERRSTPINQNAALYRKIYAECREYPVAFWAKAAEAIDWAKPAERVFDPSSGNYGRWFSGAVCNTCHNAVDRHVANGRAEQAAVIYESPITGSSRVLTYLELQEQTALLGAVLQSMGVHKGDRVVLYMPMIPEALIAMLACARIGAVHCVVFGGFAAKQLATRIEDAQAKVILCASCGIEPNRVVQYKPLVDEAIALSSHKPEKCLVLQRPQAHAELHPQRDLDWADALGRARKLGLRAECVPVEATDPLYILYTSGTTGTPKGVVRDNGGHMVALSWSMENLYGVQPGDVYWAASDVGWVVGHSYIVYGPLLRGCTTLIYEGKPVGTPDPGAFWNVVQKHQVKILFTAPTAIRAIKREDPEAEYVRKYDLSSLKALFLAGEHADPDTVAWAENVLSVPVVDHWWQTETGWAIAGNPLGIGRLPAKKGSPTVPMPGFDVQVLDYHGHPVAANTMGSLVIKLPLPPGCFPTLWNSDSGFVDKYLREYPGYYSTSDAGYLDEDGYLFIMGRTDDIINVAGHRLSTGSMEEVLSSHHSVAECAVVGVKEKLKGEIPCGFVVLKKGACGEPAEIEKQLVKKVRETIGPVAAFKLVVIVPGLPKTRSGKILRRTLKEIADGAEWIAPATIEDASILNEIADILASRSLISRAPKEDFAVPDSETGELVSA
jgi:propionyl-CoA synthetase